MTSYYLTTILNFEHAANNVRDIVSLFHIQAKQKHTKEYTDNTVKESAFFLTTS